MSNNIKTPVIVDDEEKKKYEKQVKYNKCEVR